MTIYLDGEALPGYDHRVTANGQLVRKDQSGETSGTGSSHQGWKAWVIGVSCKVRFRDGADLARLRQLFQARTDAAGELSPDGFAVLGVVVGSPGVPKLYALTDPTAEALGVRQARFADFFQVVPDDTQRIWNVKFTLIEERSIPEITRERVEAAPAAPPSVPPETTDTEGQAATPAPPEGWVLKTFALFDKFAGRFFPEP